MFGILNSFTNKAELRESKDEILVGEIVRAMFRAGRPSILFKAGDDHQRMRFLCIQDPVLYSLYITLDRKTGSSALQAALIGSKATLTLSAETRNQLTDPDDLVKMYKTDFANLLKLPVIGGIKLNHELNSVYATTKLIIDIDKYISKGDAGVEALNGLLDGTVAKLREKLEPYKRG